MICDSIWDQGDVEVLVRLLRRHVLEEDECSGVQAEALLRQVLPDGEAVLQQFMGELSRVRELLITDLQAAFDADPAATGTEEILLSYPGFFAVTVYRLAHVLYTLNVPLLPRLMTEYAHSLTGIDIHPGAQIGPYFFIDHGTGVVIGQTTVIGSHVTLYQGVTLGGLSTRGGQSLRSVRRHPTIEDHVVIYAGASILGGQTCVGHHCVIGANAFITESVPPCTTVSMQELPMKLWPRRCPGCQEDNKGGT